MTNKLVRLSDAIVEAARRVGSDGKGKDGLTGYLRFLACRHPLAFTGLLAKLVPLEFNAHVDARTQVNAEVHYKTVAEVRAELVRRGIDIERLCKQLH